VALGALVFAAAAFTDPRAMRRFSVVMVALLIPLCGLVGVFAPEVKGASRWVDFGLISFQPSELLKPCLVIIWAWMMSEAMRRTRFPGRKVSLALYVCAAVALLVQPDLGQTILLFVVLSALLMLSGLKKRWLAIIPLVAITAITALYFGYAHARERINTFFNPEGDAAYQVGQALKAIKSGGVFGQGPGEGVIKRSLPDAHGDFVFAVAAEEFGLLASLGLIFAFVALAFRGLSRSARLNDPFEQLAAAGLTVLLVAQAGIHIAVNMALAPAKGMTLPFISFGGSSMIGACMTFGFLVALLRDRPGAFLNSYRADR
jgi:cell division protein FtsW